MRRTGDPVMKDLYKLTELIQLPAEAVEMLRHTDIGISKTETENFCKMFCDKEKYNQAYNELKTALKDDNDGWKMLKVLLLSALNTYSLYLEKGINENIYTDTMKCFSRFVREHFASYGRYGFDRGFWVGRQLSLTLFRIGELEYELYLHEGEKVVSLHIPSDADLSPEKISASVSEAQDFLNKYYPDYADRKKMCYSWLLSPALKNLLPENSRILSFAARFEIVKTDENAEGYKQWVFKNKNLKPEDFPETTTLQKNMKKYVLSGGKIGESLGFFK